MKEKLLRTKNELSKEYGLNENEIKKLKDKIKILNSNLIEVKFNIFAKAVGLSFPILMIVSVICGLNAPNFIGSIIGTNPFNIIKTWFIGSIISGIIVERIASKINYKKLNRFSNAKTEEQKREEVLGYELEVEKLNDKNNAIDRAYEFASNIETNLNVCTPDFGNSDKTKEEQEQNNKKLREKINDKEKELEISTTQEFINDKFVMLRSKMGKLGTICTPILFGIFAATYASLGTIIFDPTISTKSIVAVNEMLMATSLCGGVLGISVSAVATYLRRKQDRRIFNKFNNRLGENKLPENSNNHFEELGKIRDKRHTKIDELASTHLAYQDSTRELERLIATEIIEEESALDVAIKGAKKLDKLNLKSELDERMQTIMQVAHQEESKEVEGPTLVKRR